MTITFDPAAPALSLKELWANLQRTEAKDETPPKALPTLFNLNLLLRASEMFRGKFKYNRLSSVVEVWGGPCFPAGAPTPLTDTNVSALRVWFAHSNFKVEFKKSDIWDVICVAAQDFGYDPLQDYLNGLVWDGVPRIATMLETYFQASTLDGSGNERSTYLRAVSKRWMISAAARGLSPGEKVDTMLVFQGKQGVGKSTAAAALGLGWFVDFQYSFDTKDAQAACSANWIGEIGELASMNKSKREHVKGFLSTRVDQFRAPYDRAAESHPRRIVFIGTTNDDQIFSDETGNRRFWPVSTNPEKKLDVEGLKRDRDQLWAEAVHLYKSGEQWHLTPEEDALAVLEQAARMQDDSVADKIVDWFERLTVAERGEGVRAVDVHEALGGKGMPSQSEKLAIASALRRLGFVQKGRAYVLGVRGNWWVPPESWLQAGVASKPEARTDNVVDWPKSRAT